MSRITEYLIWSNEHRMWWGPAEVGYTTMTHEAGRYSKARALDILEKANIMCTGLEPNEVMCLAPSRSHCEEAFTYAIVASRQPPRYPAFGVDPGDEFDTELKR